MRKVKQQIFSKLKFVHNLKDTCWVLLIKVLRSQLERDWWSGVDYSSRPYSALKLYTDVRMAWIRKELLQFVCIYVKLIVCLFYRAYTKTRLNSAHAKNRNIFIKFQILFIASWHNEGNTIYNVGVIRLCYLKLKHIWKHRGKVIFIYCNKHWLSKVVGAVEDLKYWLWLRVRGKWWAVEILVVNLTK